MSTDSDEPKNTDSQIKVFLKALAQHEGRLFMTISMVDENGKPITEFSAPVQGGLLAGQMLGGYVGKELGSFMIAVDATPVFFANRKEEDEPCET